MNKNELAERLKKNYKTGLSCGVMVLSEPAWKNISFVVPPPPPSSLDQTLPYGLISKALKVLSALPSYVEMSELDKLINYLFVRREVVQSSRLEGTWSTIDHALTPGEISDQGKGKDEHTAVRNYAKILEQLIDETAKKKEKVFNLKVICKIQKEIVQNDPNSLGIPGKLRTPGDAGSIVTIGGLNRKEDSIYNPAPPSEVKRCLEEVLDWFADSNLSQSGDAGMGGMTLPVRLAIGHSHFEAVHPFSDGNGRTGRSLWPLQMVCAGSMPLYLSGYVEEKKQDYNYALAQAQKRLNYNPMIEFICHAIIESYLEVKKSKEVIEKLPMKWKERGKFRSGSAAERALTVLLHKPIINSTVLQEELKISLPASTNALNQLVERGIIRYRYLENRKAVYAAEELVHILARPFGSDIDLALEKARKLLG